MAITILVGYTHTYMVMLLENKLSFDLLTDVLSVPTLIELGKHASVSDTDISSYDIWPTEVTEDDQAPECFTHNLTGKIRSMVLHDIFMNDQLPCYKQSWVKNADVAIQKIPHQGFITRHIDTCEFSLTVFLNTVHHGGHFVWADEQNNEHYIKPVFNSGVYAYYETAIQGAQHEVLPVRSKQCRSTLQLFVFDKTKDSSVKPV